MSRPQSRRLLTLAVAVAQVAAACSAPILANEPLVFPSPQATSAPPSRPADPIPVDLPRDDGPHDRLTEWWYYTGHLHTADGRRFGFEAVVFRAERGSVPPSWASHLALTQEPVALLQGPAFHYAQRSEIGPQVDHSPRDASGAAQGFDLQVGGLSPTLIANGAPPVAAPWRLAGGDGTDHLEAALAPEEAAEAGASFGLNLDLGSTKPAALHDGDGFVDFGAAGSSYYYSRTRMDVTGTLELDGEQLSVEGIAWFDHQWGDFVSVGGGGWDWFAINLGDGTDLTLSLVRAAQGNAVSGDTVLKYGTLVDAGGRVSHLTDADFSVEPLGSWQSPRSGHTYAAGWRISVPGALPFGQATIELRPTVVDQELDTRATTGVAYWEGSQDVLVIRPTLVGVPTGEAYVEMTRYSR
jgi:predicted secreted hydrolase